MNVLHRFWTGILAAVAGFGLATAVQGQMSAEWQIHYFKWTLLAFAGSGFALGFAIGPWVSAALASYPPVPSALQDEDEFDGIIHPLIPKINAEEMSARVRTVIQDPVLEITPLNPKYGSWRLRVSKGKLDMEYVWGPLPPGFGGRDLARPITPDDTPFDFADERFLSVDEALGYLQKLAGKYGVVMRDPSPSDFDVTSA